MLASANLSEQVATFETSSIYPSGAFVTVQATFDGRTCFVSDAGKAALESELLGATASLFARQGQSVASQMGVGFDKNSIFVAQVSIEQLVGAVKMVAAASHKTSVLVESRMSEQADKNDRDLLVLKLKSTFGTRNVDRDVEFAGASSHKWRFASRVQNQGRFFHFDFAKPSHSSVFSLHTKFIDVSRVEKAPRGVIVIDKSEEIKEDYLNLLQQAAGVLEIEADTSSYEHALEAA